MLGVMCRPQLGSMLRGVPYRRLSRYDSVVGEQRVDATKCKGTGMGDDEAGAADRIPALTRRDGGASCAGNEGGKPKGLLRSETLAPCDNGASYVIRNGAYKPNSGHGRRRRGARPCERHWGSERGRERERGKINVSMEVRKQVVACPSYRWGHAWSKYMLSSVPSHTPSPQPFPAPSFHLAHYAVPTPSHFCPFVPSIPGPSSPRLRRWPKRWPRRWLR